MDSKRTAPRRDFPPGTVEKARDLSAGEKKRLWDFNNRRFTYRATESNRYGTAPNDYTLDMMIESLGNIGFFRPERDKTSAKGRARKGATGAAIEKVALLRSIAGYRNSETMECYPSYETIARTCGVDGEGRNVGKLIERLLVRPGILGLKRERGKENGKFVEKTQYDFSAVEKAFEIANAGGFPRITPHDAA